MQKGLIKVSVIYPSKEGANFDMDYYLNKHIPMVSGFLGDAVKGASVEKGLEGQPYMAIACLYFESISSFEASFGPHAEKTMADVPNYTNIEPVIQISEVVA